MNLSIIKQAVTSKTAMSVLKLKKHSPQILFGAGTVGVVTTAVLAGRGTLRAVEVLDEIQGNLQQVRQAAEVAASPSYKGEPYTEQARRGDLVLLYSRGIMKLTKAYGPALVSGALTIACFTKAHNILTTRNVAITAAYSALQKGFDEYRARVNDSADDGDLDRMLRYGSEEMDVKDDNGKIVNKKRVFDRKNGGSIYARFFGPDNKNWMPAPEYNLLFLRAQQNYANEKLQAQGYLLLNDVYDALGMDRSKEGCVVGWTYKKNAPTGDNYVDFGVFTTSSMDRVHDFVTGHEGVVLLDFNVDGVVYDEI